jgi:hypothetical protein
MSDEIAKHLLATASDVRVHEAPKPVHGSKTIADLLEERDPKIRPMIERVEELKHAEETGDLAFMDYSSWLCTGNVFQRFFRDWLNPLFWGSCYFEHSRFVEGIDKVIEHITPSTSGTLIQRGNDIQVLMVNERYPKHDEWKLDRRPFIGQNKVLLTFNHKGVKDGKK